MPTVSSVLSDYSALSTADQNSVKSAIISALGVSTDMEEFLTTEKFSDGRKCPHCENVHVSRNGHSADGRQRYICHECGKTFSITTGSIASGTRKDIRIWEKYIDCMMRGLSLRDAAYECKIHYNTAFAWRHKILDVLQKMADMVKLDGIIEADETFFAVSYKGNHSKSKNFTMPRKAHKRGHQTKLRGISHEKVCVPCAVNRNGMSVSMITNLGRVSTKDLHKIYDSKIVAGSTFITDKMNSYTRFCKANGIELVQLKSGKSKNGIYHIQHINNYHGQLKQFMNRFYGVSTKYLNNYLTWHNFVNYAKEDYNEKKNILLRFVLNTPFKECNIHIPKRKCVPI